MRFNKVTFLSAKIAMQLRSPGSFCPSETSVHLSCRFQRDVLNLDPCHTRPPAQRTTVGGDVGQRMRTACLIIFDQRKYGAQP